MAVNLEVICDFIQCLAPIIIRLGIRNNIIEELDRKLKCFTLISSLPIQSYDFCYWKSQRSSRWYVINIIRFSKLNRYSSQWQHLQCTMLKLVHDALCDPMIKISKDYKVYQYIKHNRMHNKHQSLSLSLCVCVLLIEAWQYLGVCHSWQSRVDVQRRQRCRSFYRDFQ